jgi:tRNA nucleotidyltransferase (CCA-adding enzyme)
LQDAGHQAFAVGGAVRDAILGRPIGDWDVTTSAHPDEVQKLFVKTLPTGIEHGTVTVLLGRGRDRHAIEITSFRGEGEYDDARRPNEVTFGVSLEEDLARRDFVMNAVAYDPIADDFEDPYAGTVDIAAGVIRAVGDPAVRFAEDGLRIMRGIRFVAALQFRLDEGTEAAIRGALPSLAKVARERVRDELFKLLRSPTVSPALAIALRSGVAEQLFRSVEDWPLRCARADLLPHDPPLRLAALLFMFSYDLDGVEAASLAEADCRELKLSNDERARVVRLIRWGDPEKLIASSDVDLRRHAAAVGREGLDDLIGLWRALVANGELSDGELPRRLEELAAAKVPLSPSEMAISGGSLIKAVPDLSPGPEVGETMRWLFERVLSNPDDNTPERLLELAKGRLAGG